MTRHIAIVQGHPDPAGHRFCRSLANAYMKGAEEAGHEVKVIDVATLDFPLLRSKEDFESGAPPDTIRQVQTTISWAEHLLVIYPLWLGTMPALLKAFFEQVFRPGFAMSNSKNNKWPKKLLTGKSARIVITMGMPGLIYRWYYRAHSLRSLERNIFGLCGISPIKENLIGMIEACDDSTREKWLAKMQTLGREGK